MAGITSAVEDVLNDNISTVEEFVSQIMPPAVVMPPLVAILNEVKRKNKKQIKILAGYQSKLLEKAVAQNDITRKDNLLRIAMVVSQYIERGI